MEYFMSVVSFLAFCSINGVIGGAIPLSEKERSRRTVDSSVKWNSDDVEPRAAYIPTRRMDREDLPGFLRPSPERDELLDRLRIELQAWHETKHSGGYTGQHGPPKIGGKSLLGTLSAIVGLVTTVLPWLGINPPQPMMSGGGQMMAGGGQMMMMQGGGQMMQGGGHMMQGGGQMTQGGSGQMKGQMMQGGGQMMQGGGQMMQGGGQMMQGGGQMMQGSTQMMGGNFMLVPLYSNDYIIPYHYPHPYIYG